jgi:hypothetical protein
VDGTGRSAIYQDGAIGHHTLKYNTYIFALPFPGRSKRIAVMPFFFQPVFKGNMSVMIGSESLLFPAGGYSYAGPGTTVITFSAIKIPFHRMIEARAGQIELFGGLGTGHQAED